MHQGNLDWLRDLNVRYRDELAEARLLELGSLDVNGTARSALDVWAWIGIDKVAGPGVDHVLDARHTTFPIDFFDVILCTSMLEHDPNWRDSLSYNVTYTLRVGGLVFLSWGAEGNQHHLPEPWALVPVFDVRSWAARSGLIILERYWEAEHYTADCPGCYSMVLQKGPTAGIRS